jgi:hypothetical protein
MLALERFLRHLGRTAASSPSDAVRRWRQVARSLHHLLRAALHRLGIGLPRPFSLIWAVAAVAAS